MKLKLKDVLVSDDLPSLPAVAVKVLEIAREAEPDMKRLVRAIKADPALAARILRTANSSLFGLRQHIAAIEQAVPLLGTTTVSGLVLGFSLAANSMQPGRIAGYYQLVWRASLIQAAAADRLCRQLKLGSPAEFFVAGLLQDVGMLATLRVAPNDYVAVLENWNASPEQSLVEIEQQRLGFTHADVGEALSTRWKLTQTICRAIGAHHSVPEYPEPNHSIDQSLAPALATASSICDFFVRESKHHSRARFEALLRSYFRCSGDSVHALLSDIDCAMRQAADLFSVNLDELPPYEELLACANNELAQITLRAQIASLQAGAQIEAAKKELDQLATQAEQLRMQASRDPLTGAYNRACFEDMLERERSRCARYGGSLGLIFIDLDRFKHLNDTYGHLFGDEVLQQTVNCIRASLRDSDTVARFGGEEFVVLALNLTEHDLTALAERIRRSIESLDMRCGDQLVRFTASLGVTMLEAPHAVPLNRAQLVGSADKAMYDAKRLGGNQVRFASCA